MSVDRFARSVVRSMYRNNRGKNDKLRESESVCEGTMRTKRDGLMGLPPSSSSSTVTSSSSSSAVSYQIREREASVSENERVREKEEF